MFWVTRCTSYVFWLQMTETSSGSLLEVMEGYQKLPKMAENQIWKWINSKASLEG